MENLPSLINYAFVFLSIYVQIFFIFTFFEKKKSSVKFLNQELSAYPSISVIVPCFNEEKSVAKTIESLLKLDYPKNKLEIIVVDDGSRDKTWEIIKSYANIPGIRTIKKENGGKFTALNEGLKNINAEFFSCLDADSTVEPDALKKIMPYFNDTETMAVIPSAIIPEPKNIIQKAQVVEYNMSVFFKKIFSLIGGLYVTPGTLPIYRKKVVDLIGGFRYGHNGEDAEMAFRMQKNHMKIAQCHEAKVYTIPPSTLKVLFKQRVRWISAYLGIFLEYRGMLFRKKYGNFGFFTMPTTLIALASFLYVLVFGIYNLAQNIVEKIIEIRTIGLNFSIPNFDVFYINTNSLSVTVLISFALIFVSIIIGNKLAEDKIKIDFNVVYYFVIYTILSPFWILKSVYNVALSKKTSWR